MSQIGTGVGSKMPLRSAGWAVSILLMMLMGCASMGASEDPSARVTKRADERWQLLIAGKVAEAYEYLSPGSRSLMSREQYQGSIKPGLWRAAKVDSVECKEDQCRAQIRLKYFYKRPSIAYEGERLLEENWIKEGGSWWYVPR
jgi:hypothetical protein